MYADLQDMQSHSDVAHIIILGSHIDYEEIFNNHCSVFSAIIEWIKNSKGLGTT